MSTAEIETRLTELYEKEAEKLLTAILQSVRLS